MVHLSDIQESQRNFVESRKWDRFKGTQVFTHLIEELGEIGSHLLYNEKYKVSGAGHKQETINVDQEFAQSFNLLLQLAIIADVNLEDAWDKERQLMESRFSTDVWYELAKGDE